ncbi:MAG: XRE family transcriptional regulator [Eubacteriales bacterium]|nr:XRE family transcriptional regulator [Eubacteriales bacterium]
MKKPITKELIIQRAAELAFGKANDCIRLALMDGETDAPADLSKLDLSLLTEFKRGSNGAVEIRLVSRLDALRLLADLIGEAGSSVDAVNFLQTFELAAQNLHPDT